MKMSIKADIENILIQLNYPVNESTKKQLETIIDNTNGFYDFAKHIFSLQDELKKVDAIVAMSNTKNFLKIKCNAKNKSEIDEFEEIINKWADKYKVKLEKVENKNTYYITDKNA
jgi:hypothetical protein